MCLWVLDWSSDHQFCSGLRSKSLSRTHFRPRNTSRPSARFKLLGYYADLSCIEMSDGSDPNVKEQCKSVCPAGEDNGDGKTVMCSQAASSMVLLGWIEQPEHWRRAARKSLTMVISSPIPARISYVSILIQPSGVMIKKGYCICNLPIIEFAGNFCI